MTLARQLLLTTSQDASHLKKRGLNMYDDDVASSICQALPPGKGCGFVQFVHRSCADQAIGGGLTAHSAPVHHCRRAACLFLDCLLITHLYTTAIGPYTRSFTGW